MVDRYTKVVLTVIAVALVWLCLWGSGIPRGGVAHAEYPQVQDVNIAAVGRLPVTPPSKDALWSRHGLPVEEVRGTYAWIRPQPGPVGEHPITPTDVCRTNFKIINTACQAYFAQNKAWPNKVTDMLPPDDPQATTPVGVRAGYLTKLPICPFGTATSPPKPYALVNVYQTPGDVTTPVVGVVTDWKGHWDSAWWMDPTRAHHIP